MTKGPAGYGRYNDTPEWVGCPWSRTSESPCVARDGQLALAGDPPETCVCCGNEPAFLLEDLAREYPPADQVLAVGDPSGLADEFAALVRQATEPQGGETS